MVGPRWKIPLPVESPFSPDEFEYKHDYVIFKNEGVMAI